MTRSGAGERGLLEDRGWFSPRELDELEDHLRGPHRPRTAVGPRDGRGPRAGGRCQRRTWRADRTLSRVREGGSALMAASSAGGLGSVRPVHFVLPGFVAVAFGPSRPSFGMSAPGYEFVRLGLEKRLDPPGAAQPPDGPHVCDPRARPTLTGRVAVARDGAAGVSALGLGVFNLLRPFPLAVDDGRFMYGHLGTAYWVWSASFALVAVSLWLRKREWAPGPAHGIGGVAAGAAASERFIPKFAESHSCYYIYRTSISKT